MPLPRLGLNRGMRGLLALILALLALGPLDGPTPPVYALDVAVNTTADTPDVANDNVCADATGKCSLRAALQELFDVGGTITSTLPAGSVIMLNSPLQWYGSNIRVEGPFTIDASGLSAGQDAIQLWGDNNQFVHATIRNAPRHGISLGAGFASEGGRNNFLYNVIVIGSGGAGIHVVGAADVGGDGNVIDHARLGHVSGTTCIPSEANQIGLLIEGDAARTYVGFSSINCNTGYGIYIAGDNLGPLDATVEYNRIGTNDVHDLGNGNDGIHIITPTVSVTVTSNIISGNGGDGVHIEGSRYITVADNIIGTNAAGNAPLPNTFNGVRLDDGASFNTIGGFDGEVTNLISGNGRSGVYISGSGTQFNLIEHNFIGLDVTGTFAVGNGWYGIEVNAAPMNFLGTSLAGVTQFISGNTWEGIYLNSAIGARIGQTNRIGVGFDGVTPVGNGLAGISLVGGTTGSWVVPGIVAHNGGAGIEVLFPSANNLLSPALVYANGGLPIDLGRDGHTPNDPGDADSGANGLLNYPVITDVAGSVITGTVCAACRVVIYTAIGDPSQPGGGGQWLDSVTADGSGIWSYTLPAGFTWLDVSLLACQGTCGFTGETSEMSPRPWLALPFIKR